MSWTACVTMSTPLLVAVAVIEDSLGRFLITRRPWSASHGGYWEFPGGKIELGETADDALVREMHEELGLTMIAYQLIGVVEHRYPHRVVELSVYYALQYEGIPQCLEEQLDLKWIWLSEFQTFQFPEANAAVLDLIQQYKGTNGY